MSDEKMVIGKIEFGPDSGLVITTTPSRIKWTIPSDPTTGRIEIYRLEAEVERLKTILKNIQHDIEHCDWSCERCGQDYGMPDTDIALYVTEALK